uniref:GINS complex subunit 4 n=1 Tax=Crocodylus porosus TaxID=8502 RepID=A0A7M4DWH8_CROPO
MQIHAASPAPRPDVTLGVSSSWREFGAGMAESRDSPDPAGHDSDGGSEELVLTPAQLIRSLEQAWLNEKFAPELLESKAEVVECVMEQLEHMESNLKRVKGVDLKVGIHRMEIERIRYVLSSYLRCRLGKIEKFFPHVLEKEKSRADGDPSILSPEEFAFAKDSQAQPGLLRVPARAGAAGERPGGAGGRRAERVHHRPGGGLPAPDPLQDHRAPRGLRRRAAHLGPERAPARGGHPPATPLGALEGAEGPLGTMPAPARHRHHYFVLFCKHRVSLIKNIT